MYRCGKLGHRGHPLSLQCHPLCCQSCGKIEHACHHLQIIRCGHSSRPLPHCNLHLFERGIWLCQLFWAASLLHRSHNVHVSLCQWCWEVQPGLSLSWLHWPPRRTALSLVSCKWANNLWIFSESRSMVSVAILTSLPIPPSSLNVLTYRWVILSLVKPACLRRSGYARIGLYVLWVYIKLNKMLSSDWQQLQKWKIVNPKWSHAIWKITSADISPVCKTCINQSIIIRVYHIDRCTQSVYRA